jgi:hypothetical protein
MSREYSWNGARPRGEPDHDIIGALRAELDDDPAQEVDWNRELCAPATALPAM